MKKDLITTDKEKKALVNYLTGIFTNTDSAILNVWLNKNEKNKLLFDQFVDIWQAGPHKNISSQINIDEAWNELNAQLKRNKNSKLILWHEIIRIAAVFVIAIFIGGLGFYFLNKNKSVNPESRFVEYVSPLGSRSFVKLADGSKVWLNSGSTIKYRNSYGINNRELILTGEAFFEVEKNKNLPFVVKTSEIDITALGTKFNVKAYSEEKTIETTLIEGSVKLESSTAQLKENLFLKPNEKAVFTKRNQSLELITQQKQIKKPVATPAKPKLKIIESVEVEPIISWKDKRWVIHNEKLGDLSIKLERRFDVNFIFDNEILKEYSFGGTLEDETLEQIMKAISFTAPIKYIINNNTVYVMADGKKMEKFKNLLME